MLTENDFYKEVLDNLYDGIYFVDYERRITYWNRAAERITGYQREKVQGSFCYNNILMHVDYKGTQLCKGGCPLAFTIADGKMREADVFLHHADGHRVPVSVRVTPIHDTEGKVVGAVEVFSNNASKMAALERITELQRQAFIDPLTQIGNRRFTEMKLQNCLDELKNHDLPFGILMLDIDHFKRVNDTYGHSTGDLVLSMVANTLRDNLRSFDFAGRWGGEEFIVILSNVENDSLTEMAEKLRMLIASSQTRNLDHSITVQVTTSIGATLATHEDDMLSLIDRADRYLYQSKFNGRNQVSIAPVVAAD